MANNPSAAADFIRNSIRHNNTTQHIITIPKFPCGICNFDVKHNDKSILCTECGKWVHIRCTEVSGVEYKDMQLRNRDNPDLIDTESWACINCVMDTNTVDSMKLYDMLPEQNVFSDALKTNCLHINDENVNDEEIDLMDPINYNSYSYL